MTGLAGAKKVLGSVLAAAGFAFSAQACECGFYDPYDNLTLRQREYEHCWTDPSTGLKWIFWMDIENECETSIGNPNRSLSFFSLNAHQCIQRSTTGRVEIPRRLPVVLSSGAQVQTNWHEVVGINTGSFLACTNLTEIVIPDCVRKVSVGAFYWCHPRKITAPFVGTGLATNATGSVREYYRVPGYSAFNGVGYLEEFTLTGTNPIPAAAFASMERLRKVSLPEGLTAIPNSFCEGCPLLEECNFPSTLKSVGEYAFMYVPFGKVTIRKGIAYDSCVFCENDALTELVVEPGCTRVPVSAVHSCHGLVSVSLPETLETIDRCAFCDCTALAEIQLPASLTNIGHMAFAHCTALKEIRIPAGVTSIGKDAFLQCSSLKRVYYHSLEDWYGISFATPGSNPLCNGAVLVIDGVEYRNLQLPEGSANFNLNALDGFARNGRIAFPDSFTSIPADAFAGNEWLTSVDMGGGIVSIGDRAFKDCRALTNVVWSQKVSQVGDQVFYGCDALSSLTIPDTVTTLGTRTFMGCSSLSGVRLPEALEEIGDGVFDTTPLDTVTTYKGNTCYISYRRFGPGIETIVIPRNVRRIGKRAFYATNSGQFTNRLKSVTFAPGCALESIGEAAFCRARFSGITLPDRLVTIGTEAFGLSSITSIALPDSVRCVGTNAFNGCGSLADVSLNDGLLALCAGAFRDCRRLADIDVPRSLEHLGSSAFYNCMALARADLTSKVTEVPSSCFYWCTNLTTVVYGDAMTSFGDHAFYWCSRLRNLTLPENLANVPDYCFYWCDELPFFTLPSTVTNIGAYAFYAAYADNRTATFVVPDSVVSLQEGAFCDTYLRTIVLGRGLKYVGPRAFYYAESSALYFYGDKPTFDGDVIDWHKPYKWTSPSLIGSATIYVSRKSSGWGEVPGSFSYMHKNKYSDDTPSTLPIKYIPCEHFDTEMRNAVEPTCTAPGKTADVVCTNCGEVVTAGIAIPALGHQEDGGTVVSESTAFSRGIRRFTCVRCHAEVRDEHLDLLPLSQDTTYRDVVADLEPQTESETVAVSNVARLVARRGDKTVFDTWAGNKAKGLGTLASRLAAAPNAAADYAFDLPVGTFTETPAVDICELDASGGLTFKVRNGEAEVAIEKLNAVVLLYAATALNGLESDTNLVTPTFVINDDGSVTLIPPATGAASGFYRVVIP